MEKIQWHIHHIIPKHMGGTDDPRNLIKVNIAMHAFLHKLLWEEHGHHYDRLAYESLSGQISNQSAWIESGHVARRGKALTEEHKEKIRQAKLGKKLSKEHIQKSVAGKAANRKPKPPKEKIVKERRSYFGESNPFHNKQHSDDVKKKISEANSKEYKFVKDGEVVNIKNLKQFCLENDLNYCCMNFVSTGKTQSHKGYKKYLGE